MKKVNRIGEKHLTNEGLVVTIIKYNSAIDCSVQYEDGFVLNQKNYHDIKRGKIKNPYNPIVYGIGFIGEGHYKSIEHNKRTKSYLVWSDMLRRCYTIKILIKRPNYANCTIALEWHNFQNFAKWFEENYNPITMNDWHLDKDILVRGNRIYGPDTCCFVPHEINILFANSIKKNRQLPIGVVKHKDKFRAQISIGGKTTYCGLSEDVEKAFVFYKNYKEKYLKEMANKWKNRISDKVYQALINYKVEITD